MRFDRIYAHVHFIPMDSNGIRLLKILSLPNWNNRMLDVLFDREMRPQGYGFMEYDAFVDGTYIYSHLDSDIARLIRFRQALETQQKPFEVLCFPWQTEFLHKYLGGYVKLKQLEMDAVEAAMEIPSRSIWKGVR